MKVLIGTKNQGKIEGATKALRRYFDDVEVEGVSVPSDVSDQPLNEETFQGAKNRVKHLKEYAKQNGIDADLYLAIESGITNKLGFWMITNIAVIEDKKGGWGAGTSPSFPIPERLVEKTLSTNLAVVMDDVFGQDTDRHNHGGGIQLLTHDEISRIDLNEYAFVMALTKFVNGQKWSEKDEGKQK